MSAHSRAASLDSNYVVDSGTPTIASPRSIGQFRELRLILPESTASQAEVHDQDNEVYRFAIANVSSFGCRIKTKSDSTPFHVNQTLSRLILTIEGQSVFDGPATVMNESSSATGVTYGLTLQGYGLDLEKVRAILETQDKVESLSATKSIMALVNLVRPDFKIKCANLNAVFQDLRMRLLNEQARINESGASESYRKKLESQAIDMAMALYQSEIHKLFEEFQEIVENMAPEEQLIHKRFFRITIHPLLLSAPFIQRAFSKPLGYAGDYGLMVMFYEYQDLGADLFGKFMHRFACNEPAAVANKNRVEHLADRLGTAYKEFCATHSKGSLFKVSTVACGPAKEIEIFLTETTVNEHFPIHIVLIDQESAALEHAQSRLRQLGLNPSLVRFTLLAEDAVLGIIKRRAFANHLNGSQFIISAGLFDYLSDRVAEKLIAEFHNLLAPEGNIIIGNVSRGNPDRFSMEYVMEWQLILRDESDLLRMCNKEWVEQKRARVISEVLGLNLFLEIHKRG